MIDGEQDADGDLAPEGAEQTEAAVPQVSFNQFNQQVRLIFPPM